VLPSLTVSGSSGSVSGSHSRSMGVGLGGGVQRIPSGNVGRGQSRGRGCEAGTVKRRGWLRIDCTHQEKVKLVIDRRLALLPCVAWIAQHSLG